MNEKNIAVKPTSVGDESDVNDEIKLPADTQAILNEFLRQKKETESLEVQNNESDGTFEEDWQLSQFWYDDETKRTLSKICLKLVLSMCDTVASSDIKIALLSCPSLYKSIKAIHPKGTVRLFEYDNRFAAFTNDFTHYDYKNAYKQNDYLNEFESNFDIIIADPPFLSEECIQSMGLIIDKLKRKDAKIVLCSGQVVAQFAKDFLHLDQCNYRPHHERNLANEFCSYANFNLDELIK